MFYFNIETEDGLVHVSGFRQLPVSRQKVWWVWKLLKRYADKMSPKINLSWGLDAFDQSNLPKTKPYAQPTPSKQKKIPSGLYKKDEEEEL